MRYWILGVGFLTAFGCTDKAETGRSAPAAPSGTSMPAGHPPIGKRMEQIPALPNGEIEGQLELAPGLEDKVKAGDPIFLIARNAATGSTIAVARLEAPASFPMPFRLTGKNVMMAGRSLAGKVRVLARVDKDGEALSKNPGDVVGEVKGLVEVPAKNVILQLDKVL